MKDLFRLWSPNNPADHSHHVEQIQFPKLTQLGVLFLKLSHSQLTLVGTKIAVQELLVTFLHTQWASILFVSPLLTLNHVEIVFIEYTGVHVNKINKNKIQDINDFI